MEYASKIHVDEVYIPCNSRGHIRTGTEHCHLWESNPHRSDSHCDSLWRNNWKEKIENIFTYFLTRYSTGNALKLTCLSSYVLTWYNHHLYIYPKKSCVRNTREISNDYITAQHLTKTSISLQYLTLSLLSFKCCMLYLQILLLGIVKVKVGSLKYSLLCWYTHISV